MRDTPKIPNRKSVSVSPRVHTARVSSKRLVDSFHWKNPPSLAF